MFRHSLGATVLGLLAVALVAAGLLMPRPAAAATVTPALTEADAAAIVFMREEEKMARDLYTAFADQWGLPIFSRIAVSEQRHFDSIGNLIVRYALDDPAENMGPGEFANAEIQALYDQLLEQGKASATAALQVGVTVEETDIADLDERIAAATQPDVKRVFTMLRRGSTHHLAAFSGQLGQ